MCSQADGRRDFFSRLGEAMLIFPLAKLGPPPQPLRVRIHAVKRWLM